jgi:hypothetical protein
MPLRLPKMYFFIFGFQRFVWCPKWNARLESSFIVIWLMALHYLFENWKRARAPR